MGYTSEWTVILDTNAGHVANPKIYRPPYCLVPTDTADAGKHKLCNGIDHYSTLIFIEDAAGGSQNLSQVLTTGSDGGGQDVTGLQDVTTSGAEINTGFQTITAATAALDARAREVYLATATVTLPASPVEGRTVRFLNQDNVTTSTIARNGKLIDSAAADVTLLAGQTTQLKYVGGAWYSLERVNPATQAAMPTIYMDAVTPALGAILVPFTGQTAGGAGVATIYLTDDGLVSGNPVFSSIVDIISCRPLGGTTVNPLAMFGAQANTIIGADPADPVTVQVWRGVNPVVDGTLQTAVDGTSVQIWVAGIPA